MTQPAPNWHLVGISHINAIVDDYQVSLDHFTRLGLDLSFEVSDRGDGLTAFLMTLGDAMIEFFAPLSPGENVQGRLLDKVGNQYIGLEYEVADVTVARQFAQQTGIPIIIDLGSAFFTDPRVSFGVSWEIYGTNFNRHLKPASYWRDEHPLGVLGIDHLTLAVTDVDRAVARLLELTDSTVIGPIKRPGAAASGTRVNVGNLDFELLQPTGDGPLAAHLARYGEGIRSTVWNVADLDRVARHLAGHGFDTVPGDDIGALAIDPTQNLDLRFEFTE